MPVINEHYQTIDKEGWGDGPWMSEEDKYVWVDSETDLDCMIVRNGVGALCGYVGVSDTHPWFGLGYDTRTCDEPEYDEDDNYVYCEHRVGSLIAVHGGLTFAAGCQEEGKRESSVCHIPQTGRPSEIWWFGFDCAHAGDFCPAMDARMPDSLKYPRITGERYRDVQYVIQQIQMLAKQLVEVTRFG